MRHFKTRYYRDLDGYYVAVTTETPRGPLKGFVFVGRRLIGDVAHEDVFANHDIVKWTALSIDEVPPRYLTVLGYDVPPLAPEPEPEPEPVMKPLPVEKRPLP